ncbi:PAS domain S-box-containing protein/diguanylate cyclase (GGDEF) domain-containing protein [Peptoclostridium litorale DSM 5388]|uniref:Diguanylate cyclase/phosphodiesterase n=1 Tax=Peptoclostridium litorale DSM 5388 TaxID=1121324 RepID=A0A069RF98_PEPLI|nr:GGDEF domain-containing phosphodiesterase [Peptoclostridium litorale]KDR95704.1 diguanylate cyclase/phosphodiesterase [Peptoclostridium litorale DSM 5388]SIO01502.1 PAS domain S-box-containing protein/diguanylate cyclase (GGDEF) domain-containing protein [Peptoclostridium litorale DSM 5388]
MNNIFEKLSIFGRRSTKARAEFEHMLEHKQEINPGAEASRIAIMYGVAGTLWIMTSDWVVGKVITNQYLYRQVQMYKGWLYVVITMMLLYFLIKNRMEMFKKAMYEIYMSYEELSTTYEELTAMEDELRENFDELKAHRDALFESEQRYELAVEGSNDGIWDWDVKNDKYYSSLGWVKDEEIYNEALKSSLKDWTDRIHPQDRAGVVQKFQEYLRSKSGIYENRYRIMDKDGIYIWVLSRGKAIWDNEGEPVRIAGSHTDITEYKKMEEKLQYMAYYDELTGLPNRNMFEVEINRLIDTHKSNGTKFAVVYMDVDNFKHVNDTLGHASGDMLLTYIADILKNQLDREDMPVRLSGDEFSILIGNMDGNEDVANKLDRLIKHLRRPWILQEHEFFVSFSMGVAVYPDNGDDMTALLKSADTAMFSVKENGKDSYCFYTDSMQEKTLKHIDMINSLRRAIEEEEFVLYYQPLVNMKTGEIEGMEALVRWFHSKKGFISPLDFIPLAEETGQILEIGSWVLKTACNTKRKWEDMGFADIKMSINLSSKRLANSDVDRELERIIQSEGISVKDIQIEVTETAVMKNINTAGEVLQRMRDKGIKIALDDFGTGYSSLTYLKNLPIDVVKIDRGFIKNIEEKKQDEFIVKTVVELAHGLGKEVVAEGIETKRQLEFLREIGCDTAQGYLFSRPVPAAEIENMLIQGKNYSELVTGVTE